MASYLDKTGLTYLWGKITTALSSKADTSAIPTKTSDLSNDSHFVASTDITNVVYLTQSAYDALATKDSNTLYIIPES